MATVMPAKNPTLTHLLPATRVTESEYAYLQLVAETDGITVSEAVRRIIDSSIVERAARAYAEGNRQEVAALELFRAGVVQADPNYPAE